jgi:hypothetical protein
MEPSPTLLSMKCVRDAKARRAWSVVQGDALRVRHAVDWLDLNDDMEDHYIYEHVYAELRQLGYPDAY